MKVDNTCSACQKEIPRERQFGNTMICTCGWTKDLSYESQNKYRLNKTSGILIAVAVSLIISFIHIVNWDKYSLTIIPVKVRQVLGLSDIDELKKLLAICRERKKWNCVINAYNNIYEQDSSQIEILHKLGKLYVNLNNDEAAVETYKGYFDRGGVNIDAYYEYAKSLGRLGKTKDSISQYKTVLELKPNTLQTTVVKSYVKMLMANKMWREARKVIENYRKKSRSAEFFMESEMKKIKELI